MRRRNGLLMVLLAFVVFIFALCFSNEASAYRFANAQDCLNQSGGRQDISSVIWACDRVFNPPVSNDYNVCALWLGTSGTSDVAPIKVNEPTGTASLKYWGMCTLDYYKPSNSTSRIYLENDNGSVASGTNFQRGLWASPNSLDTTLDIEKFLQDLSVSSSDWKYDYYDRNDIVLWRCNATNMYDCSSQSQPMRVGVRRKYILTAAHVDSSGISLASKSGLANRSTSPIYAGDPASIDHGSNSNYDFQCWKTSATGTCASTESSYSVSSLQENTTVYASFTTKAYTLEIDKDSYSTATVKRTASPAGGSTNSTLSNGDTIYEGDTLEITMNGSTCHPASGGTYEIDGDAKKAGTKYTITVSADVSVYARSPITSYKLTISQGTGTTISVNRDSVAAGSGASTGSLSNNATIYCGDELSATMSVNTGYDWSSHSFVGLNTDDTIHTSISSHTVGANVTVTTSATIQKKTLTAIACNTSGQSITNKDGDKLKNKTHTVNYGSTASVTRGLSDAFTYKGWKNAATCATSTSASYATDTSTSSAVYVSGSASPKETFNVKSLTSNGTVAAIYEIKSYNLTITSDEHSSATVRRTSSPYADAATEDLASGSKIYYGDVLSVSYSYDGCLSDNHDWVNSTETVTGSISSVNSDVTVAVTSKDQSKTITVKHIDTDGTVLSGVTDVSVRTCYNKDASVDRRANPSGYTFVGWKQNTTSTDYLNRVTKPSSGYYLSEGGATIVRSTATNPTNNRAYGRYNYVGLTDNLTRYAVFVKKYTLTAKADKYSSLNVYRTSSNTALAPSSSSSAIASAANNTKTATVYEGDALKFSAGTSDCWKLTSLKVGSSSSDATSFTNGGTKTVVGNVYGESKSEIITYMLNVSRALGTKVVVKRNTAATDSGVNSNTVLYSKALDTESDTATATLYCGETISAAYEKMHGYSWGSNLFVGKNVNDVKSQDRTYGPHGVRADVTVKTYDIIRNEFAAQASVAEGVNWSDTSNRKATGFVEEPTSRSIDIDCLNSGCKTNLWLQLRTIKGDGSTRYRIGKSENGSSVAWIPAMSSSGTEIWPKSASDSPSSTYLLPGTTWEVGEQKDLVPGGNYCRYVNFKPYGVRSNDEYITVHACANAKVSYFEGLSKATSDSGTDSTGWTSTTKNVRHVIKNCASPTTGCNTTIQHALKRSNSIGSTDYNVSRTSNLWVSSKGLGVEPKTSIGSGTFDNGSTDGKIVVSDTVKLYPGMVVCERMTFKPNNNQVNVASDVSTTVCVSAEGNAQPDDPTDPDPADPSDPNPSNPNPSDSNGDGESGAYLRIEVKNNNNIKYNTYRRIVYAKPNDNLTYRAVYNPTLQYTYYLVPERMQINSSPSTPFTNNSGLSLGGLFNANRGSRRPWNNAFNVSSASFVSNVSLNYDDYANGDTSRQRQTNDHKVQVTEVGKTLTETATINQVNNSTVQTTPSQVSFRDVSNANVGNVMTNQITSTAYARIPYNFNTKVEVTTPEDKIMYSGEDSSIGYEIEILKKRNSITGDGTDGTSYATIVRDAKWRVINYTTTGTPRSGTGNWGNVGSDLCSYYSGVSNCGYSTIKDGQTLNGSGKMAGDLTSYSSAFNVPDVDAGTRICVAVAFYPSSSGSDINLSSSGSGQWRISDSKCYQIAKKPSFQLWGGGMYIAGDADVPVSAKNNLAGYPEYSYQHTGKNGYNVFGSWVETGLVAGGSVSGLASGAGTGYTSNNGGELIANPGGSRENSTKPDYCKRSTLSFANDNCSVSIGNIGGSVLQASMSDKSTLVKRLLPDDFNMTVNTTAERININTDYTETESGLRYTYSANDLIIDGATLANGVTHIVRSDKDITIDGELLYQDSNYTALNEIPKLIIYGDNITVSCKGGNGAIKRIDAILIANNTVDTCKTVDVNSRENSYQLKINGLIIADTLKLNRTYGAGKGVYSIVPAEIINYDTTLYLWSMVDSPNATGTGKYSESYLHELSPRY